MHTSLDKPVGYMIAVGETDRQRLDALGAMHNPPSLELMTSQCTIENPEILDVGCGNGGLTCLFAKTFNNSKVVGVDISAEQIDVSTKRGQAESLSNVFWDVCDVYHLEDLKEKHPGLFDIVHSRFVLTHISDLPKAVDQMLSMVKPGGLLILEEVGAKKKFKETPVKAMQAWKKMVDLQHKLQHSHHDTVEIVFSYLSSSDKVSSCTSKIFDVKVEGQLKKSMFRMGAEQGVKKLASMGKPELVKGFGYDDAKTWLDEMIAFENDDTQSFEIIGNESIIAKKA